MTSQAARVSGLLAPTRNAGASDAELLGRFVAERDGSAFATLVTRHGPMVFGVCQRIVRDWHTAEDAFQATFLVLARRAASISPPGAVAGWLHGVARLVAKDARRAELRRTAREYPTAELLEPVARSADAGTELRGVLDDELRKLPGKYRDLLVACDLEERPRAPVAAAFGIPEGTLSSRLTTARRMLAERLAKRGIAPGIVAAVALGGPQLVACEVPRMVLTSAARLGSDGTGTVSVAISSLASRAIRAMTYRTMIPVALAVFTVIGALSVALAATHSPAAPTDPPAVKPPKVVFAPRFAAPAKQLPKGPNKLLVYRTGNFTLLDPDGKNDKPVYKNPDLYHPTGAAMLSPDGKQFAVMISDPLPPNDDTRQTATLHIRGLDEKEPGTSLDTKGRFMAWSPDGTEIVCCDFVDGSVNKKSPEATHIIVNVKTKEKSTLKLPHDHILTDWSRDGKFFLTTQVSGGEKFRSRLYLMNGDGTEHKALTDENQLAVFGRLSPDGTQVLFNLIVPKEKAGLSVVDVATRKTTKLDDVPLNGMVLTYCWAPDGKKIAYIWRQAHEGKPEELDKKETESHLIVCDPDGKNPKTIISEKGEGQSTVTLGSIDWR
ncbi:sigma-70 family RNA polymerase sigma factor [Gemmata sp. G18]|uniref:Sigma-70 family RNA polymerase sigma factor n=1 Tax=Gemmata palustris TaxID=2822762 RepID=A0ABS5BYF0_9BACT|nr:sigma-70 family RNA polymerase sigma factor [Gemmata palustris]MBP3958764.1 sigma-70 family RNA polymerase sigma factor [Gemmata palustris]